MHQSPSGSNPIPNFEPMHLIVCHSLGLPVHIKHITERVQVAGSITIRYRRAKPLCSNDDCPSYHLTAQLHSTNTPRPILHPPFSGCRSTSSPCLDLDSHLPGTQTSPTPRQGYAHAYAARSYHHQSHSALHPYSDSARFLLSQAHPAHHSDQAYSMVWFRCGLSLRLHPFR